MEQPPWSLTLTFLGRWAVESWTTWPWRDGRPWEKSSKGKSMREPLRLSLVVQRVLPGAPFEHLLQCGWSGAPKPTETDLLQLRSGSGKIRTMHGVQPAVLTHIQDWESDGLRWTTTFELKNNNNKVLFCFTLLGFGERGEGRIRGEPEENMAQSSSLKHFLLTFYHLQKHFLTCVVHLN